MKLDWRWIENHFEGEKMGDLFNGWDEDGEPEGDLEYEKRSREYYDRKVARAEDVAIPAVIFLVCFIVVALFFKAFWFLFS